jgi:hypothetical protein
MVAMSVALSLAGTTQCRAQQWISTPSLRVGGNYDSNIRLVADDPTEATNGLVDASWTLSRNGERLSWRVTPRFNILRYSNQPLLDRTDKFFFLDGTYAGERVSWLANAGYVHDSTLTSELGLSGITEVNRPHDLLTAKLGPTVQITERVSAQGEVGWSQNRYDRSEGTGLTDYDYGNASLSSGWKATANATLSLSGYGGVMRLPDSGTTSRNVGAQLRIASPVNELLSWELAAGPSRVITDVAIDNGMSSSARLGLRNDKSALSFGSGRDVIPTGRGSLSRREYVSLDGSYRFAEYLTASADVHWTKNRDVASTLNTNTTAIRYTSANSSLRWFFLSDWSVSVHAGWAEQAYSSSPSVAHGWHGGIDFTWRSQGNEH